MHPQGSAEGSAENSVNFIENNGRINALNNLNNGQYLVITIINSGCAVPLLKSELQNDLKNELKNDLKNDLKNVAINDDQNQKVRDNNNNKSKSRTPLGFTPSPRALSLRIAKGNFIGNYFYHYFYSIFYFCAICACVL